MYLFEDAVKSKKTQLFEASTYSQLCQDFELEGLKIFKGIIEENLAVKSSKANDESAEENNIVKFHPNGN